MTVEKAQHNWRLFRAATLVAIACSPLFVAASSYSQTAINKETNMAQPDTPRLHAVPQAAIAEIRPFHVNFSEEQLANLRRRVAATQWPERETVSDATQGVQLATTQKLARYWATDYDWRKVEARLNAVPQFVTTIDGLDIHSYVDVTPLLASAGYRVIVPYLRGYGTTHFLSSETFRNGQQSAVAVDIIDLMDALKIEKAVIAGFDWGARTADIIAALWPERCKAIVSVSGYLIGTPESNKKPLPPKAELEWRYQFYFATERGRAGYAEYRHDFAKLIWQTASPKWSFDDATFNRSARSFDNPDHVAIAIHNYRWRLGLAKGEPRYDDLEKRLAEGPVITVPAITLEGDAGAARNRSLLPPEILG